MRQEWQISIVGGGHVGLTLAVCFAERGYHVHLHEKDPRKAQLIAKAVTPFFEPGLEELLKSVITSGKLEVSKNLETAIEGSKLIFITVGTPSKPNGEADLKAVKEAGRDIGKTLKNYGEYCLIVMKSTVPPGTTGGLFKQTVEGFSSKKAGEDFGLAMQPEFLSEGSAVNGVKSPDRIVIGEYDRKSGDTLEGFYREFYGETLPPILRMSLASAEMVKYASNAFLAVKISFINQIARLCEKIENVDVIDVANGVGLDKRIGRAFLDAGAGFGGPCLKKDLKAFTFFSNELKVTPHIFEAALKANEEQRAHIVRLVEETVGSLEGKRIAVLGLAFKPNTDDVTDAPSITIIQELLSQGAEVVVYDPAAVENTRHILGNEVNYAKSPLECLKEADCCIVLTEWEEFRKLKPEDFISLMRNPTLVDARRIYNPNEFKRKLKYVAIGLGRS